MLVAYGSTAARNALKELQWVHQEHWEDVGERRNKPERIQIHNLCIIPAI
jgi:hypothetical protein